MARLHTSAPQLIVRDGLRALAARVPGIEKVMLKDLEGCQRRKHGESSKGKIEVVDLGSTTSGIPRDTAREG